MIVQHEFLNSHSTIELFSIPYFKIYDNFYKKTAIRPKKDLTKHINNQIVLVEEFVFEEKKPHCTI